MSVIARWEWRAFGDDLGAPGGAFVTLVPDRVDESVDLYLLSRNSDASVKARDGLLDVKTLLAVAEDGLEQWVPVLKAPFPVAAADVAAALKALRVPVPELKRRTYTVTQLCEEIAEPSADLRVVEVAKRRTRYSGAGCLAELSEMKTPSAATWSVAVEAEDPAAIRAAVRTLGLHLRPVVCVARGLKALVGFGAYRYAVIDVGTNSVKLHISERRADGSWHAIADRAEVTRLGQGLDASGRLSPAAIDRTLTAVAGMADEARRHDVAAVAAVGTAALRLAPNAAELVDAARARSGVEVEVIPGEEETRLAYLATKAGLPLGAGPIVVFDTGGGSSQFTFGQGDRVDEQFSLDVGAARFTERYGLGAPVSDGELAAALAGIAAELSVLRDRPAPDTVVGMGGAVTNLAAVRHGLTAYAPDVVHGTVLDRAEIDRQIELYRTRDAAGRREIPGLQPARAEVILAGACIVRTVLTLLGRDALTVSDRGLRHGVLVERFAAPPPVPAADAAPLVATGGTGA